MKSCKDIEFLSILYKYDFIHYKEFEKPPHSNGCIYNLILDDCFDSDAFTKKIKVC